MSKTIRSSQYPDFDTMVKKVANCTDTIPVCEVGEMIWDTCKFLFTENKNALGISDDARKTIQASLICSMYMTLLSYGHSKEEVKEIAKSCGVDEENFEGLEDPEYDA